MEQARSIGCCITEVAFSLLQCSGFESWLLSRASSASCFRRNSSYSGVPGLGGASLGRPPIHAGVQSITFSETLSIVVEHDASATQAISSATTRVMLDSVRLAKGCHRGWATVETQWTGNASARAARRAWVGHGCARFTQVGNLFPSRRPIFRGKGAPAGIASPALWFRAAAPDAAGRQRRNSFSFGASFPPGRRTPVLQRCDVSRN